MPFGRARQADSKIRVRIIEGCKEIPGLTAMLVPESESHGVANNDHPAFRTTCGIEWIPSKKKWQANRPRLVRTTTYAHITLGGDQARVPMRPLWIGRRHFLSRGAAVRRNSRMARTMLRECPVDMFPYQF